MTRTVISALEIEEEEPDGTGDVDDVGIEPIGDDDGEGDGFTAEVMFVNASSR